MNLFLQRKQYQTKRMPTSYQQRVIENTELRRKNKLLQEELDKMRDAIAILNNSIFRMGTITYSSADDLKLQFEELCREMEEDKEMEADCLPY